MPFTLAHAAAALPLRRVRALRALPLDALVVGTMVPDLPLFVAFVPSYRWTHSPLTAVPVGVACGLVILLLSRFAWPSTVWLMPEAVRSRIPERTLARRRDAHGWSACAGLALGVVTHLLWDSFTHNNRLGVQLFPALARNWVRSSPIGPLPGYKLMQLGSSVVGMVLVAVAASRALQRRPPRSVERTPAATRTRIAIWSLVLVLAPMLGLARAYAQVRVDWSFKRVLTQDLAGTWLLVAAGVLLAFALGQALYKPQKPAEPG